MPKERSRKVGGQTSSSARPQGEARTTRKAVRKAERTSAIPDASFVPHGTDAQTMFEGSESDRENFEDSLPGEFWCPARLRGRSSELVEEANVWHYSMVNDEGRSRFFWEALAGGGGVAGKRVLDLGAGSGLLSMIACKLGAKSVLAIEANSDLALLAQANVARNGMAGRVNVLHALSTELGMDEEDAEAAAEVLVSETLGTLLNGESTLDYLADARRRLAVPGARVVPAGGAQDCVLISSATLARATSVSGAAGDAAGPSAQPFHGLDLSAMNLLRDTTQVRSPNTWGLRLSELPDLRLFSRRIRLFELDFAQSDRHDIPASQELQLEALESGVVHAVVATWEVWGDSDRKVQLSTHLPAVGCSASPKEDSKWSVRDQHFSQALQLIEDVDATEQGRFDEPVPFRVTAGEQLWLRVRHNAARTDLQFSLHRAPATKTSLPNGKRQKFAKKRRRGVPNEA